MSEAAASHVTVTYWDCDPMLTPVRSPMLPVWPVWWGRVLDTSRFEWRCWITAPSPLWHLAFSSVLSNYFFSRFAELFQFWEVGGWPPPWGCRFMGQATASQSSQVPDNHRRHHHRRNLHRQSSIFIIIHVAIPLPVNLYTCDEYQCHRHHKSIFWSWHIFDHHCHLHNPDNDQSNHHHRYLWTSGDNCHHCLMLLTSLTPIFKNHNCSWIIQLLESPIPAPAPPAPSQKASSDDISGTKRGTIDPLVSKRQKQILN